MSCGDKKNNYSLNPYQVSSLLATVEEKKKKEEVKKDEQNMILDLQEPSLGDEANL